MKFLLKYFEGFLVLAFAGIISQLIALLTWRYLGQLFTLESIGEFTLDIFWIELISVFGLMGIETFYPKYRYDRKFSDITFNFTRDIALLSVLFVTVFLLINDAINLLSSRDIYFYLIVAFAVIAITNFRFNQNVRLVEKNLKYYGIYQVVRPIVFLVAISLLIKWNFALDLYISYLFSFACLFLFNIVFSCRPKASVDIRKSILWIRDSYHFAAVGIFGIVSAYSSRLLTDQIFTLSEVGLLALLVSFAAPVKSLVGVFDKVYYPSAIKSLNRNGNLGIGSYSLYIISVAFVFLLGFKLFMPTIGSFFAITKDTDLRILRYLYYSFYPMLIWVLFVPIIIQNNPKKYARLKGLMVVVIVIVQAVIFSFISFDQIGLPIYLSECVYLVPLFVMIGPYLTSREKRFYLLYTISCLFPVILN